MHLAGRRGLWKDDLRTVNFDVFFVPTRRQVRNVTVQLRRHHHELRVGYPLGGARKYALEHRELKREEDRMEESDRDEGRAVRKVELSTLMAISGSTR